MTGPIGAGRQLPPRPQQRGCRGVDLWDLRHLGKVLDLDLWRRFLGLLLVVVLLDDLGDGDVGLDLDPLVGVAVGVGIGVAGVVRVGLPLQDNVGRAEIVMVGLGSKSMWVRWHDMMFVVKSWDSRNLLERNKLYYISNFLKN